VVTRDVKYGTENVVPFFGFFSSIKNLKILEMCLKTRNLG
jgi:hypothetical protein